MKNKKTKQEQQTLLGTHCISISATSCIIASAVSKTVLALTVHCHEE